MVPDLSRSTTLTLALLAPVAMAVAAPLPPGMEPAAPSGGDLSLTETYCDLRGVVTETLRHDFAEEPRLAALTGTGMTMELWASDLLGTWTLVHHGGDGISCIVTSGQDWEPKDDAVALLDRVLEEAVHRA